MAQKKYLDLIGLQKFAASLLSKFALKTHNHDGVYAKTAHTHSADNITSGVLPVGRGGTGATTAARAVANLFPKAGNLGYVATIGSDWSGGYRSYNDLINDTWSIIKSKTDPLYQPKGSYAAASHTHAISQITNLQAQLDSKQPKGSYAAASHQHSANDIIDVLGVGHGGTGLNLYGSGNSGVPYVFKGQPQFVNAAVGGNTFLTNNAGTLTFQQISASHISDLKSYLLNNIYKVGYVWISYTNTSPASIIGGSWVAITGRFPYFNAGTGTGGANSQAHNHWTLCGTSGSEAEIYFCNGEQTATRVMNGNGYGTYIRNTVAKNPGPRRESATYSTTVNNMPAYQTLYAWRRTA